MKTIVLLLFTSVSFSQVILNNDKANAVRNKLIECSYTEKELTQINDLLKATNLSVDLQERIITSLKADNERLLRVLDTRQELIELGYKRESELNKEIKREKRKKIANKWFYLGVGAVGGYFGYKLLR
jgi:predicted ribosome quality control (RQC) complex YloA/Tae2 family protein